MAVPPGDMVVFDQRPFIAGRAIDASLANEGYAFVPASCRGETLTVRQFAALAAALG